MTENLHAYFVGAGAVGSFYSWILHEQGVSVTLQTSNASLINNNGLSIESKLGYRDSTVGTKEGTLVKQDVAQTHSYFPQQAVNSVKAYIDFDSGKSGPKTLASAQAKGSQSGRGAPGASSVNFPRFIFVTTKVLRSSYQAIAASILPMVKPDTVIVLLQNGINFEHVFKELYPNNLIISGIAFIGVGRTSQTDVKHVSHGRLVFGIFHQGVFSDSDTKKSLNWLEEKFEVVGCKISDNILKQRFKKLVWNAAFNPLSVLGGEATTDIILKDSLATCRHIMDEILVLAKAFDCELPHDLPDFMIEDTKKMPPYKTSMLLDKINGRPLEIHAILGQALEMARQKHVHLPVIQACYDLALLNGYND